MAPPLLRWAALGQLLHLSVPTSVQEVTAQLSNMLARTIKDLRVASVWVGGWLPASAHYTLALTPTDSTRVPTVCDCLPPSSTVRQ